MLRQAAGKPDVILLYVYNPNGGLQVYDPTSGTQIANLTCGGGHWNSPIVVDGRIALPEPLAKRALRIREVPCRHQLMTESASLARIGAALAIELENTWKGNNEMTNPFEDENATYLVLVNGENQHSLWPSFLDVPAGWNVAHPADSRQACLDYSINIGPTCVR